MVFDVGKKEYTESIEYCEWLALKEAHTVMEKVGPTLLGNICFERFNNFEYYLNVQRAGGHSEIYDKQWSNLNNGILVEEKETSSSEIPAIS